jgi:hypothetical protein
MRIVFPAALVVSLTVLVGTPGRADPYRWCADYGGGFGGGGTNCYFVTFEQCRAAVSGVGGFCRQNGFYDGRPVTTPETTGPRSRRHR